METWLLLEDIFKNYCELFSGNFPEFWKVFCRIDFNLILRWKKNDVNLIFFSNFVDKNFWKYLCIHISIALKRRVSVVFVNQGLKHRRCSIKKTVYKYCTKFTGKHLCWSIFCNKVAGLRIWQRYFPVNFPKFLTSFLQNT